MPSVPIRLSKIKLPDACAPETSTPAPVAKPMRLPWIEFEAADEVEPSISTPRPTGSDASPRVLSRTVTPSARITIAAPARSRIVRFWATLAPAVESNRNPSNDVPAPSITTPDPPSTVTWLVSAGRAVAGSSWTVATPLSNSMTLSTPEESPLAALIAA